jgi:predicted HicB family RNase H-like nuclease
LPGCTGVGDSFEEAISSGKKNMDLWLETARENGVSIPDPSQLYACEYSGKFGLRLPKYLHRNLSLLAEEHNTSLNQLCVSLLSEGVASINSVRDYCLSTTVEFENPVNTGHKNPPRSFSDNWSTGSSPIKVYASA